MNIIKRIKHKISSFIVDHSSPIHKSPKGRFIFIHINKTGGTSIAKALNIPFRHLYVKDVLALVGEARFQDAFVFTVVRNPWDKVVSQYKHRININKDGMRDGHISFKDWVKEAYGKAKISKYHYPRMFDTQLDWLRDQQGVLRADKILRFETLEQDYEQMIRKPLGRGKALPHLNATNRRAYQEYYDTENKNIIADYFREDIEYFNYTF